MVERTDAPGAGNRGAPVPVDPQALRQALGSFLTGVTIVTTVDAEGRPRGLTANSFTSVSLRPPLVLVCVDQAAASFPVFRSAGAFAVSILHENQSDLAARFASKRTDKFEGVAVQTAITGVPILHNAVAWVDCVLDQVVEAGDHIILIGLVLACDANVHRPLGYCRGSYVSLAPERDLIRQGSSGPLRIGWIAETQDAHVLLDVTTGETAPICGLPWTPPHRVRLDDQSLSSSIERVSGGHPSSIFLFSVFDREEAELNLVYRAQLMEASDALKPIPGVKAVPVDEIPWQLVHEPTTRVMLRRYLRERAGERFGLYTGSEVSGTVATLNATIDWNTYAENARIKDGR